MRNIRLHLEALAGTDLAPGEYLSAALEAVRLAVPCEGICVAVTDPVSMWTLRHASLGITDRYDDAFLHYEYAVDDVNKFGDLAAGRGVAILHEATDGDPQRSARYRDILAPLFGVAYELRGVVRSQTRVLGTLALYREAGAPFTETEARRLGEILPGLQQGLRKVNAGPVDPSSLPRGVLVFSARGALRSGTRALVERLEDPAVRKTLGDMLATASAMPLQAGPQTSTLRFGDQWASVSAELLSSGDVAVAIGAATPAGILETRVASSGLTAQETRVLRLLLKGRSTAAMSQELFISAHTVQDHFKSIFQKLGVHSRRELLAALSSSDGE